jgi:hypothetical protein
VEPIGWFSLVFLVLLKIPLLYLCYVVWWAVKQPPASGADAAGSGEEHGPDRPQPGWWWRKRAPRRPPLRHGPHGSPERRPAVARAPRRERV